MKVLIAEDDPISRRLMQAVLSPYGLCHAVENGKEALDAFKDARKKNQPYDLICLDIMMPEMDGNEVLCEIRSLEEKEGEINKVKVIMTTALSDPKTIMKCFRQHCEDYLIKPIDRTKLLDKIRMLGLIEGAGA